jgi:hypothetical protein
MNEKVRRQGAEAFAPIGQPIDIFPGENNTDGRQEKKEWYKSPTFLLVDEPHVVDTVAPELRKELDRVRDHIYDNILSTTESIKSPSARITQNGELEGVIPPDSEHGIVIKPVYVGELSPEAKQIMQVITAAGDGLDPREEANQHILHQLRDALPEVVIPLIRAEAKKVEETAGISSEVAKNNFVTALFINDTDDLIDKLPFHWRQYFNWMQMSKFGSFKTMIVPYRQTPEGEFALKDPTLATLEGGHVTLPIEEMTKQLAIFGSAHSTGGIETPEELINAGVPRELAETVPIEKDTWENSSAVNGLIRVGKFLGRHSLLSPPVKIRDLVTSDIGYKIRQKVVNYSMQAEGAFYHYDPNNNLFVVSSSGRFGAVKDNLTPSDVVPVIPAFRDKTKVTMLSVEGYDVKPPSVEASEFINPIDEFMTEYPDWATIQVTRREGGFVEDKDGDLTIPAIYGILHLHREYDELPETEDIIEVTLPEDIVVGCGVDLMEQKSREAMQAAIDSWNNNGRKAKAAFYRVGRHGVNIFAFPTPNEEGIIPEYAFEHIEKMIESQKVTLHSKVRQDHTPIEVFQELSHNN